MSKLPAVKPSDVIRVLEGIGFYRIRQKGSHLQMKRGNLLVTIPVHSKDLNMGTLSIEEFLRLL
jgi:predicted RNA binding protein YcfA (HicA-like mRNA interferase family)